MPETQFGCAKGRGIQQAAAHTQLFIDSCRLSERSFAILFVDLSKAFDFAIREVLFGWKPSFCGDKVKLLQSHGLAVSDAFALASYIDDTGGLLRELGVDEDIHSLFNSLHDGAWFVVGRDGDPSRKPALVSTRRGRQGCRLCQMFN